MSTRHDEIKQLLKEIKVKLESIVSTGACIKEFNYKLEALLTAFEAYTSHGPEHIPHTPESALAMPQHKSNTSPDAYEEERMDSDPMPHEGREESLDEFLARMDTSIPSSKLSRNNTVKIVRLLYSNREGVTLDDLIRGTGVSRYRCIDLLNAMLKTDPPLASKRFDRGFVYTIALL